MIIQGWDCATLLWEGNDCGVFLQLGTLLKAKELWNRSWNMPPTYSAQYLRVHPLLPRCCVYFGCFEGSDHIIWIKTLSEEIVWDECCCLSQILRRNLGNQGMLLPTTWMVLLVGGAIFTAAMFLRPCQTERRLPSAKDCLTLSLYFSLAALMAHFTFLLTSFFSTSQPVKKTLFLV